jgi:hypothetical protein
MPSVTVACKLPLGIIVTHKGKTVTFNGANHPDALVGHGLTNNVDAEWFADFVKTDGADFAPVVNHLLFANTKDTVGEAEEKAGDKSIKTGLEPIDPENPGKGIEAVPVPKGA